MMQLLFALFVLLAAAAPLAAAADMPLGTAFTCDNTAWVSGKECINKPSSAGITYNGVTSQADCGDRCAASSVNYKATGDNVCCYWKNSDSTCKLYTDFSGFPNEASGDNGRNSLICTAGKRECLVTRRRGEPERAGGGGQTER